MFAAFEDFGITPIEALAAGTPFIAYQAGGALDYVFPGKTGAFFAEQTVASLVAALQSFNPEKYNSDDIKKAAEQFNIASFHKNLLTEIERILQ